VFSVAANPFPSFNTEELLKRNYLCNPIREVAPKR